MFYTDITRSRGSQDVVRYVDAHYLVDDRSCCGMLASDYAPTCACHPARARVRCIVTQKNREKQERYGRDPVMTKQKGVPARVYLVAMEARCRLLPYVGRSAHGASNVAARYVLPNDESVTP